MAWNWANILLTCVDPPTRKIPKFQTGASLYGGEENYQGGRDLYQNYIPLRREKEVVGHAVFFTYLYAGATDVYLETGDRSMLESIQCLWVRPCVSP